MKGRRVVDLLSGERIAIENGRMKLTVPAGLFRILAVQYRR